MGKEIERKFLVVGNSWRTLAAGEHYRQGYLTTKRERTVRVRIVGPKGYLTIKGIRTGISRLEFEYEIPGEDANIMLDTLCERPLIEKIRYKLVCNGLHWEVDEFEEENKGLIIAEVELRHEKQQIELPEWIGREVSYDPRYSNSNLVKNPYSKWEQDT